MLGPRVLATAALALGAQAPALAGERADLIIGHVWTVDDARPEAAAVAVAGLRIYRRPD